MEFLLWADMDAATPLGAWGRSVMSLVDKAAFPSGIGKSVDLLKHKYGVEVGKSNTNLYNCFIIKNKNGPKSGFAMCFWSQHLG